MERSRYRLFTGGMFRKNAEYATWIFISHGLRVGYSRVYAEVDYYVD